MKLIYFAHPYGGEGSNKKKAADLMERLQKTFTDFCFVSPIHGLHTDIDYDSYDPELAMKHCIELLSRCDELWTVPEWGNSAGCKEEVAYCVKNCKIWRIVDADYFFRKNRDDLEMHKEKSPLKVKIKLVEGGIMPTKGTPGAAAFDCYAKEDTTLLKGSSPNKIPLGFCMEIPTGYHAKILPRSSTGLNTPVRIPNACGIIDSDYRGEVNFIGELNFSWGAGHYFVTKGTRIAQMIIEKNEDVELVEASELSDTERGSGGFGSTGK